VAAILGVGQYVFAQEPPRTIKGDVLATVGWLSANTSASSEYADNNWVSSLSGAVSAGWHWTDNLKTEGEFGTSTKMRTYRINPVTVQGRPTYQATRTTFSRQTLAFTQQYQFFHNVWFHPHLGAGVTITWERAVSQADPIFIYDPSRGGQSSTPGARDDPRTRATLRPFVASGFKAYVTERTFFRSDVRMTFRGGPDEVLLRVGFGIDF
jgi:outer membrane protein W